MVEMTTPNKQAILEKARELWHEDRLRKGDPSFDIEPEPSELAESGFISAAKSQLMQDQNRAMIEEYFVPEDRLKTTHFQFDIEQALASGVYVSGTTGSGKSDLAMMHAQAMMREGVTVLVFDGTRDWITRSSIPNYITIKPNVPFRYRLNHESIIFDMSLLNPQQQKELVKSVCQKVWGHQVRMGDHWYYLIFEEGHLYFPEGCMRSKEYASLVQLVTGGRNYRIRFEIITQFSAMIDKNVMRYMRQRYCGYTDEPNDVSYVGEMLGNQHKDKLKSLKAGEFLYKLGHDVQLVQIEPFESRCTSQPLVVPSVASQYEVELRREKEPTMLQQIAVATQTLSAVVFIFLILYMITTV